MRWPTPNEELTMAYDDNIQNDADRAPNHGGTMQQMITVLDESSEYQAMSGARAEGKLTK